MLLSGGPGVGKTSCVRVLGRVLGYEVIETNASDCRSKEAIESKLKHLVTNRLFNDGKFIIVMDEVDGMSGGDRGGIKALIDIIKISKHPIICICNDRQDSKVKSLANHCIDLKFSKPNHSLIANRLIQILLIENVQADRTTLEKISDNFNQDLRQILNYLQLKHRHLNKDNHSTQKMK